MASDFLSGDVVYVNSNQRISGTTTDFTIDLSQQIKTPNRYDRATLLSFNCPKSYYLINEFNNTFTLNENGQETEIVIPTGNYTFDSLTTELNTLFDTTPGILWNYTVSNSFRTGKFLFTVTGNFAQPSFTFADEAVTRPHLRSTFTTASPCYIMGFTPGTFSFTNNSLTSPNVVKLQLLQSLILMANFVKGSRLSVIVPDMSDFGLITYVEQNPAFTAQELTNSQFQQCSFQLLDGDNGGLVNLNGLTFEFVFAIYQRNSYYEKMLRDKQLQLLFDRELV